MLHQTQYRFLGWFVGMLVGGGCAIPHLGAVEPVKVFVLAGQSNMEGKAPNDLYEHQATDPKTAPLFAHLRRDGEWVQREDAFIKFLGRHGRLTLGYGSPGRTGIELEFGTVLADQLAAPVLLIKTAWGGHSLYKQFRPPSAGLPPHDKLEGELERARQQVVDNNAKRGTQAPLPTMDEIRDAYGQSYRAMLAEVSFVRAHLEELFPELAGREFELAGFVWFQGWNDMYNGAEVEYAANLRHLIRDVRRDLGVPDLPVVILAMGQNGSKPAQGAMAVIQRAQLEVADDAEFRETVRSIRTDVLVDRDAEALYPHWKERLEEWKRTGGDRPYHYLGSAIWMNRIGHAAADAMLEMMNR